MENIREIITKYTTGKASLEETNEALAGSGIHLEPGKNVLTEEELRATTIGCYPDQANGFGLLDSGTGTLDKVEVRNGQLANCGMGEQKAMICVAGRWYYVRGRELVEEDPYAGEDEAVQKDIDWRTRRPEAAGKSLRQRTKKGVFDVWYNEDGQAVKAAKVQFN